jgi:hypothetical protein
VSLRPHGQAEIPRRLHDGDEIELDVGQRLVARAERDGLPASPDRDVIVESGPQDRPQTLEIALDADRTLHLTGLPFVLYRQEGGWLRTGFDPDRYDRFVALAKPGLVRGRPAGEAMPEIVTPVGLLEPADGPKAGEDGQKTPAPEHQWLLEMEARSQGIDRLAENRRVSRPLAVRGPHVRVGLFYIAQVPVTWAHWVEVMDQSDLSAAARADVRRFVREQGEQPAGGIPYTRWCEYCRRLTERHRTAGTITDRWEFSPPTAAEFEYVVRGGLDPVAHPALAGGRSPHLAGPTPSWPVHDGDPGDMALQAWLQVEENLEVLNRRRKPPTVWDPDLSENRLGVRLGLSATWTTDEPEAGVRKVLGPHPRSRPNRPVTLKWKPDWPSPRVFKLPDQREFLLHDVRKQAFGPWRSKQARIDLAPAPEVGLYLVLRPVPRGNVQGVRPRNGKFVR